ncbi:hypothetical protein E2I00_008085 [Balaenoptera physalus]|uniref:SGF29 C-terminal domain-containing protein n=1 Tax=Balaenoptera physalus TaxID=9770 RepID=A0A643C475_BALPH|nr:hypothetical protein E2I00_008085 [Balaenoptera physalus]
MALVSADSRIAELLTELHQLIKQTQEERSRSEHNLVNIQKTHERMQTENKISPYYRTKLRGLYTTAKADAEAECNILRKALDKIAEIKSLLEERRIASGDYVAKPGDKVAARVKAVDGDEQWILAEVVSYSHATNKYETTCFYRALIHTPPQRPQDDYSVLFEDTSYADGYSPPLNVAQRYVVACKEPKKKCPRPRPLPGAALTFPHEGRDAVVHDFDGYGAVVGHGVLPHLLERRVLDDGRFDCLLPCDPLLQMSGSCWMRGGTVLFHNRGPRRSNSSN